MRYILYNADQRVASFEFEQGVITHFTPERMELLPMQIREASAEGFAAWLRERAIDLNTFQHRQLAKDLIGSRDKTTIAILTHMFSISDTFTCFEADEFVRRADLCGIEDQNAVSDYILISSDTSLRKNRFATPNASTDGSFPKTWRYEEDAWWLYKIQSKDATLSECEISRILIACDWAAAEYQYVPAYDTRIRSRNFVQENEFFEPYDSLRFMFADKSDDDEVIYENIASLGKTFERDFRRILLADALFMNMDRHMRNFGVIRCATTGELLRMAPNFDNNQAYRANPGNTYSDAMLRSFAAQFGLTDTDRSDLMMLIDACSENAYLKPCAEVSKAFLDKN